MIEILLMELDKKKKIEFRRCGKRLNGHFGELVENDQSEEVV